MVTLKGKDMEDIQVYLFLKIKIKKTSWAKRRKTSNRRRNQGFEQKRKGKEM